MPAFSQTCTPWCSAPCVFTKRWFSPRQVLQHGVERADEEVVSELHHRQPQQMPQEEPGQNALAERFLWEWKREEMHLTGFCWILMCLNLRNTHLPFFTVASLLRAISSGFCGVSLSAFCSKLRLSVFPHVILAEVKGHTWMLLFCFWGSLIYHF